MGADIKGFLQIDDNTPAGVEPFTNDPSTWDLSWDIGFSEGKHYAFFAAISGVRNQSERKPLFPCRGLPPTGCGIPEGLKDMAGDYNVSWLTLSEIQAALAHMEVAPESLHRSVRLVLRAMSCAEELFGKDRARLVFQVND